MLLNEVTGTGILFPSQSKCRALIVILAPIGTRGSTRARWTRWSATATCASCPENPFTKSDSNWQTVPAEPDPNNPTAEAGVYDVRSGSDAAALDGTKYAEWD